MIKSIANLLEGLIEANLKVVGAEHVKHRPTIGNMYEGLTASILNRAIFSGLDLRIITNSFVQGCDSEFDVMLVQGSGDKIPFTNNQYRYRIEQVITIFQVKKNLYRKDLKESFENLNSLVLSIDNIKYENFHYKLINDSYRIIRGKDLPSRIKDLDEIEANLFEMLKLDALLPRRIVLGYNGFKSEFSLREKMYEYLDSEIKEGEKKIGFTPVNFPDLIICSEHSLVKINGMPYSARLREDNSWIFYTSSSYNPIYIMLEIIWTRLSYMFDELTYDIFGEDLTHDPMNVFLSCTSSKVGDVNRWDYQYLPLNKNFLSQKGSVKNWEPIYLDMAQYVIIGELCQKEKISLINNQKLEEFVKSHSYFGLEDFIRNLINTGLIWTDNEYLMLLTETCQCAKLPTGHLVAGENKTGRLSRWIMKEIEINKTATNNA